MQNALGHSATRDPQCSHLMTNRSMETVSSTYGRCTFTATVSPLLSFPLYTCPKEAAAIGRGVSSAYTCKRHQCHQHAALPTILHSNPSTTPVARRTLFSPEKGVSLCQRRDACNKCLTTSHLMIML